MRKISTYFLISFLGTTLLFLSACQKKTEDLLLNQWKLSQNTLNQLVAEQEKLLGESEAEKRLKKQLDAYREQFKNTIYEFKADGTYEIKQPKQLKGIVGIWRIEADSLVTNTNNQELRYKVEKIDEKHLELTGKDISLKFDVVTSK